VVGDFGRDTGVYYGKIPGDPNKNRYRPVMVRPKTVKRSEVTALAMTTGNEKRISKILVGDEVWEWVGIGWITIRYATARDRKQFPKLED